MAKETCDTCKKIDDPKKSKNVLWINCNNCTKWFHAYCARLFSLEHAQLEKLDDSMWFCNGCVLNNKNNNTINQELKNEFIKIVTDALKISKKNFRRSSLSLRLTKKS